MQISGKHSQPSPLFVQAHEAMKKMLSRFMKSGFMTCVSAFLVASYVRLVFLTTRWDVQGKGIPESYLQASKPFIVCFWHGRAGMLACAWMWKKKRFHMLQSPHRDGQLMARALSYFNISSVAGSRQRGGSQALRAMVKILRQGETVGITPDGPRGPAQVVSLGIITLARLANVDIIPVTFSTSRRCALKTWDRFHIALPLGRGVFLWGTPVSPPPDNPEDIETTRLGLEKAMNGLQDRADRMMGFTPLFL